MLASPVAEREALVASFCEVAEQSFFAFAEPTAPPTEGVDVHAEWMQAVLEFHGPADGRMRVTLPSALGLELCCAFLGAGPEDELTPGAVEDLVGEFANMACGAWLTAIRRADAFALTHPEVTRVSQPPVDETLWMSCNNYPVALAIEELTRPS